VVLASELQLEISRTSPQNLIPGAFSKPQLTHFDFSGAPHSPQNLMPLGFSKVQAGQRIDAPPIPWLFEESSCRAMG
jgi:hypothetical protein